MKSFSINYLLLTNFSAIIFHKTYRSSLTWCSNQLNNPEIDLEKSDQTLDPIIRRYHETGRNEEDLAMIRQQKWIYSSKSWIITSSSTSTHLITPKTDVSLTNKALEKETKNPRSERSGGRSIDITTVNECHGREAIEIVFPAREAMGRWKVEESEREIGGDHETQGRWECAV